MVSTFHSGDSSGHDFLECDSVPHRWILTLWRHMLPPSSVLTPAGSYRQAVTNQICEVEKGDGTHSKPINSYVHCFYQLQQHFICSSLYPTYTTHCIPTFTNEGSTFLRNVHVHHKTTRCQPKSKSEACHFLRLKLNVGFTSDSPEPIHVGRQV